MWEKKKTTKKKKGKKKQERKQAIAYLKVTAHTCNGKANRRANSSLPKKGI